MGLIHFITKTVSIMLAKSFSILFYLKKRANQTYEKLPVYLRIYIEGEHS
jgi:hypothetical protein